MRKIGTPTELAALLDTPVPWAYARGALPDAPPEVVVWFRPLTCDQARLAVNAAIITHRSEWHERYLRAALIAAVVHIDPSDPCSTELADPGRLTPAYDQQSAEQIGMVAASALYTAAQEASGWVDPAVDSAAGPFDLAAWQERSRQPGRWLTGWHPADLTAALWVRPCTEGEIQQATECGRTTVGPSNTVAYNPSLVSSVVRTGPGGPPLMTATQALALPWGATEAIYALSAAQSLRGGGPAELRFLREADGRPTRDSAVVDPLGVAPAPDGAGLRTVGG